MLFTATEQSRPTCNDGFVKILKKTFMYNNICFSVNNIKYLNKMDISLL